jgi:hypothetical protein
MCDKTILHSHTETQIANKYELRDAVVEAARGLVVDNLPLQMRVDRIASAVDALEWAEKERAEGE